MHGLPDRRRGIARFDALARVQEAMPAELDRVFEHQSPSRFEMLDDRLHAWLAPPGLRGSIVPCHLI